LIRGTGVPPINRITRINHLSQRATRTKGTGFPGRPTLRGASLNPADAKGLVIN
jgi:hypothetical protein